MRDLMGTFYTSSVAAQHDPPVLQEFRYRLLDELLRHKSQIQQASDMQQVGVNQLVDENGSVMRRSGHVQAAFGIDIVPYSARDHSVRSR